MRNKPNFRPGGRRAPLFQHSIIPLFQSPADRAKQTQLASARRAGQVLDGQRVMVNWAGKGLRRNKPNFCPSTDPEIAVPGKMDCAKQTQSGRRHPVGRGLGVGHAKPNLGSLGSLGAGTREEPIMRNEPNSPAGAGPGDERCCTNKPNSCRYADPEIGVRGRVDCAKQTQFRAWFKHGRFRVTVDRARA
jgi:hypothetical protein